MSKFIEKIIVVSVYPIMILNLLAGIIGGIWLLIIGEWAIIVFGIFGDILFTMIYPFVMLIQLPFGYLVEWLNRTKQSALMKISGLLAMFIGHMINLFWVYIVFTYAVGFAGDKSLVPYLLFGWVIAIGPFQYMASKEPGEAIGSFVAVYLTQISYILLATIAFIVGLPSTFFIILLITFFAEAYLLRGLSDIQDEEEKYAETEALFNPTCQKCGSEVKDNYEFCKNCGEIIDNKNKK